MAEIAKRKPVTPGQRFRSQLDFSRLTARRSEKSLIKVQRKTGGRNNYCNITTRFRRGGVKRAYRLIDFRRDKDGIPATVKSIEYDPNRTAYIALVAYADGEKRYIVSPEKIRVGQTLHTGPASEPEPGNTMASLFLG